MIAIETLIKEHRSLKELDPRHLQTIAGCASNVYFQAGRFIFKEGGPADQFYLIRQGRVVLEISGPGENPLMIETIGAGEILGWSWLFPPYRWRFDGRALENTHAFALDGKCLRGKCDRDHDLGYELMKLFSQVIIERLHSTRLQLLDFYGTRR